MTAKARILGLPPVWASAALIVSVALNFLAIGLVTGATMKKTEKNSGSGNFVTQRIISLTGEDRQDQVRALLKTRTKFYVKRRSQRDIEWNALADTLDSTPYDMAAVEQIFVEMRSSRDAARLGAYAVIADALAMMTDEERAALAASIRTHLEGQRTRKTKK